MEITGEILPHIEGNRREAYDLLLVLVLIPAPSNHKEKWAKA